MRQWLRDPRAYYVMKHWLQSDQCHKEQGYNIVENFRAWVALTTNHFFDVTGTWSDSDTSSCCQSLGASIPTSPSKKESYVPGF